MKWIDALDELTNAEAARRIVLAGNQARYVDHRLSASTSPAKAEPTLQAGFLHVADQPKGSSRILSSLSNRNKRNCVARTAIRLTRFNG